MSANYKDGDYLVRLVFCKNKPADSTKMQEHVQKFIRKLKCRYRKSGKDFKYIYVKEIGPRSLGFVIPNLFGQKSVA